MKKHTMRGIENAAIGIILGGVCIVSASIALVDPSTAHNLQGMLGLSFLVTHGMIIGIILAGGAAILTLDWWLTVKSVERAYGYFDVHTKSPSA
jgi:hypothetical protein